MNSRNRQMPLLPTPIEHQVPGLIDFPIGVYEDSNINTFHYDNFSTKPHYCNSGKSSLFSSPNKYCQYTNNFPTVSMFQHSNNRQNSLSCGSTTATSNSSSGCESAQSPTSTIAKPIFQVHENNNDRRNIDFNNTNQTLSYFNKNSAPKTRISNDKPKKAPHRGIPNFIKTATLVTNQDEAKKVEINRKIEIEKSMTRQLQKNEKLKKMVESRKKNKTKLKELLLKNEKSLNQFEKNLEFMDDNAFAGNITVPEASALPEPPKEWVDELQKIKQSSIGSKENHKIDSNFVKKSIRLFTRDNRHEFVNMPDFGKQTDESEHNEVVTKFFEAFKN